MSRQSTGEFPTAMYGYMTTQLATWFSQIFSKISEVYGKALHKGEVNWQDLTHHLESCQQLLEHMIDTNAQTPPAFADWLKTVAHQFEYPTFYNDVIDAIASRLNAWIGLAIALLDLFKNRILQVNIPNNPEPKLFLDLQVCYYETLKRCFNMTASTMRSESNESLLNQGKGLQATHNIWVLQAMLSEKHFRLQLHFRSLGDHDHADSQGYFPRGISEFLPLELRPLWEGYNSMARDYHTAYCVWPAVDPDDCNQHRTAITVFKTTLLCRTGVLKLWTATQTGTEACCHAAQHSWISSVAH